MRFTNTLAAARNVEQTTWAVADGLVQDFRDAGIEPGSLEFKDAADALEAHGFTYDGSTLQDYWRTATVFPPNKRRSKSSIFVYTEIVHPLWQRLPRESRHNDLSSYAADFFRTIEKPSGRKARAWAKGQAQALDAERRAEQERQAKARMKAELSVIEETMAALTEAGDTEGVRTCVTEANDLRRRLGMDLLTVTEEGTTTVDEKASREAEEEREQEALHQEAVTEIEYRWGVLSRDVIHLGHTFQKYASVVTNEDRDAWGEMIDQEIARLQVLRNEVAGELDPDALDAALAEWSREGSEGR